MAEDKIVYYKGKTLEELKKLSFEEFTALLPSELRRKIKRGFTEQEQKLLDKIKSHEKNIKTHCREMIVLPNMVDEKLGIYNGKEFVSVVLTDEMIGLRLGELAPTRKIGVKHSGAAAKKVEKRK